MWSFSALLVPTLAKLLSLTSIELSVPLQLSSSPQTEEVFFSTQRKIPVFLNLMLYYCLDLLNSPRVLAF